MGALAGTINLQFGQSGLSYQDVILLLQIIPNSRGKRGAEGTVFP